MDRSVALLVPDENPEYNAKTAHYEALETMNVWL